MCTRYCNKLGAVWGWGPLVSSHLCNWEDTWCTRKSQTELQGYLAHERVFWASGDRATKIQLPLPWSRHIYLPPNRNTQLPRLVCNCPWWPHVPLCACSVSVWQIPPTSGCGKGTLLSMAEPRFEPSRTKWQVRVSKCGFPSDAE